METNYDRWKFYCRDFKSPDIFLEFGFYALIMAALQRRVWRGSIEGDPLFANGYTFFVGAPGVGKGQIVKAILKVLNHTELRMTDEDLKKDKLFGSLHLNKTSQSNNGAIEYPSLIYVGPHATTYEWMVYDMSLNTKSVFYDGPNGNKKIYVHSSVCYCLDELGSLFRKTMDDLIIFLLQVYDCGDYKKSILSRSEDNVKNSCLNLIAATQPSFIRKIFTQDLVDGGFASRGFFVFGEENRFNRARPPEDSPERQQALLEIVQHVRKVADIFGEVKFTPEASEYLEHWSDKILPGERRFTHERLKAIAARKEVGAQKLAMAIHFGESLTMEVGLKECEQAVAAINKLDKDMLKCFVTNAKNPLDDVMKEVLKRIKAESRAGGLGTNTLLLEFFKDLPEGRKSLDDVVNFLLATNQITTNGNKYVEKK